MPIGMKKNRWMACLHSMMPAYQDKEKTLQFQWHLLKSVTTVKNNMVIAMKDPAVLTFFISRPQLGDEVFNELLEFLQGKVKK